MSTEKQIQTAADFWEKLVLGSLLTRTLECPHWFEKWGRMLGLPFHYHGRFPVPSFFSADHFLTSSWGSWNPL